jgi:phosphotriesterase-related protein
MSIFRPYPQTSPSEETINTVLGQIVPADVGVALTHEHLLVDLTHYYEPHPDPDVAAELEGPVTSSMLGYLRRDLNVNLDNHVLDDVELAIGELGRFARRGGRTVCDLSCRGIRVPEHGAKLAEIARATGLNVIVGTGYYVERFHRQEVRTRSIDELTALFITEIVEGLDGTDARAGVLGEIGLSTPLRPDEKKVLRAAGRAHRATGVPIVIHQTDLEYRVPRLALDILEEEGVDPKRVVVAHSGDRCDLAPILEVARRGAFIAYDNLGFEGGHQGFSFPTDADYVRRILGLLEAGYAEQLLLSHDVAHKQHLRAYGGLGYDFLLLEFVPALRAAGLDEATMQQILVANPARMLTPGH